MVEMIQPNDTNPLGTASGGKIMHLIDIAAAIAALRHCRRRVVTASMDRIDFLHPVHLGELVILRASVNYAGKTSLEVGVKVLSEDPRTGETLHTASAYATFVAVNDYGQPVPVPPLVLETDEDRRRNAQAIERRERRLAGLRKGSR
ncbi:MAG: acyl-CoA thioesterase [Candidatus Eisenbacteria bacterium]|nr:acyl-CoA thioesterase [Candidatus Eisenbacteria bacterium]